MSIAVCIATIPPREALLERALTSVQMQTTRPDEIIVEVDEEATGAGPTRNRAWQRATSEWVAILDDDDEFMPEHLTVCLRTAKRERADLVYPWFKLLGWDQATKQRPDPLAVPLMGQLRHPLGVPFRREQELHLRKHAFIPATIFVKREFLEKVGGYPAPDTEEWHQYNGCEDWALLIRLLDAGAKFAHAPHRTWNCYTGDHSTAGAPWKTPKSQS